jgi:hypothetical protein
VIRGRVEVVRVADDLPVLRIADEHQVVAVRQRLRRLAVDVVDELAGRIEDVQAATLRRLVKRRRHAMRGEDDRRLLDRGDLMDGADAEALHLLHDALVVDHLAEDGAASAFGGEPLHLQVRDPHAGAEPVLCCPFHLHREHSTFVRG